jgi:hypothetical protein
VLTFMSKTFATMVAKMAFDTTVLTPTGHGRGHATSGPRHTRGQAVA